MSRQYQDPRYQYQSPVSNAAQQSERSIASLSTTQHAYANQPSQHAHPTYPDGSQQPQPLGRSFRYTRSNLFLLYCHAQRPTSAGRPGTVRPSPIRRIFWSSPHVPCEFGFQRSRLRAVCESFPPRELHNCKCAAGQEHCWLRRGASRLRSSDKRPQQPSYSRLLCTAIMQIPQLQEPGVL